KYLKPGEEPKAVFEVADGDKALAVYEHCNLHGLWKTEV
ncbi:desulfoferrodoxin, partial [Candidatus Micrarchaeota archaeon]|nr:desulfoferrodoxin [Candidatus Micrarchaeota archaeon]